MAPVLTQAVALFGAGVASFLAPCLVPLLPAYLGIIAGEAVEARDPARAVPATLLFVLGFAIVFAGLGATAGLLGSALTDVQNGVQRVGGVVVAILGLALLGVIRGPLAREKRLVTRLPRITGPLRPRGGRRGLRRRLEPLRRPAPRRRPDRGGPFRRSRPGGRPALRLRPRHRRARSCSPRSAWRRHPGWPSGCAASGPASNGWPAACWSCWASSGHGRLPPPHVLPGPLHPQHRRALAGRSAAQACSLGGSARRRGRAVAPAPGSAAATGPAPPEIPMAPWRPWSMRTAAQHTSGRYCSSSVNTPARAETAISWWSWPSSVMVLLVNGRRPCSSSSAFRCVTGIVDSSALPSAVAWAPSSKPDDEVLQVGRVGALDQVGEHDVPVDQLGEVGGVAGDLGQLAQHVVDLRRPLHRGEEVPEPAGDLHARARTGRSTAGRDSPRRPASAPGGTWSAARSHTGGRSAWRSAPPGCLRLLRGSGARGTRSGSDRSASPTTSRTDLLLR